MSSLRYVLLPVAASLLFAQTNGIKIEHDVKVTMRDGTILYADIYRPEKAGRYPVLLQRTPYNKAGGEFGERAAAAGYVAIVQDVRGRYTSEGEWYPFKHESQDGYDTIEWAASLPYSNGKVGMWGGSYVGATQMLAAIAHPPHLAGICPVVTASNYHRNWTYQGGAFEQWFNQSWTSGLAQDTLNRVVAQNTNALNGVWKTPLSDYPLFTFPAGAPQLESTNTLAPYFLDWLAHPSFDEYWKQWSIEDHYSDIRVPALHVAAWYDIFLGGSLHNYEGLREKAATEEARKGQHLLVMIGGHAGGGQHIGDVDFGKPAADFDEEAVTLNWYNYLFKGVRNEFAEQPVRIFVMGKNEWRNEAQWPPSANSTHYFLHSTNGANSLRGDGTLSTNAPSGSEHDDQFVYDPKNPVPTIGGPLCCDAKHLPAGPRDQRPAEARDDVLTYSTPAFTHDVEVTGPVSLALFAKSSAVDTDFTAKLVDVWPNGFAQNLTEGILRARYRNSDAKPELINPGEVYEFKIDLWATSNVFRAGHKLRLEVSSSNFPRFDRNFNNGQLAAGSTVPISATNTVLHDSQHPSALMIPVIGQ